MKWTKEACIEDARCYLRKSDWAQNSYGAYRASFRHGVFSQCTEHMEKIRNKWTPRACIEDALLYETRTEWHTKSTVAYQTAKRLGIFEKCTEHMGKPLTRISKWTPEKCIEDALLYNTKTEWFKKSRGSYNASKKHGIFEQCTEHMKKGKRKL